MDIRIELSKSVILGTVAVLVATVYCLTLAPELTWSHWGADGGDFVTAALRGQVPHPPGAPVYMLLADLFIRLPWGSPAWRLNLLSAVMGVGAVVGVTAALFKRGWDVALVSGLTLATAPLFWSQALITELTTAAAFFVAWVLFLTVECSPKKDDFWRAGLSGLLWGLGVAVHPVLIFLAPVLWARWQGKQLGFSMASFVIGLLPYLILPLRGSWPQPWGDLSSAVGWWDFVGARLYRGYVFALPWPEWPHRLLSVLTLFSRQFTFVGALLTLWGGYSLSTRERRLTVGLLLACGGVCLYAIGYNTTDSLVYLVPFLPLSAFWLGEGIAEVAQRGLPILLLLLVPTFSLFWYWSTLDLSQDYAVEQWMERTLDEAPSDAVLVTKEDAHTFTLWYAQAMGLRSDIAVVDRDLWGEDSYRRFLNPDNHEDLVNWEDLFSGRSFCSVQSEQLVCD